MGVTPYTDYRVIMTHQLTRRFAISDATALRREIRRAVRARFESNFERAAKSVDIQPSHLYKILRGDVRAVSEEMWRRLEKLVGADRKKEIRRTMISPDADKLFQAHVRWMTREVDQSLPQRFRQGLSPASDSRIWAMVIEPLEGGNKKAFEHQLPSAALRRWQATRRRVEVTADGRLRLALAIWRIWEPLYADPSGLERSRQQLTPAELKSFLGAGVTRECILLRRPLALEQSQLRTAAKKKLDRRLVEASAGASDRRTAFLLQAAELFRWSEEMRARDTMP